MCIRTLSHLCIFGKHVNHCFRGMCCLGVCIACIYIKLHLFLHLLILFSLEVLCGGFSFTLSPCTCNAAILRRSYQVFYELGLNCKVTHVYVCCHARFVADWYFSLIIYVGSGGIRRELCSQFLSC